MTTICLAAARTAARPAASLTYHARPVYLLTVMNQLREAGAIVSHDMNGAAVADVEREPEGRQTAVAAAVIRAAENIDTKREKSWRLQVAAPRWALVRSEHEAGHSDV